MKKRILFVVGICFALFSFIACSADDTDTAGTGAADYTNVTANIDDQVRACFNAPMPSARETKRTM